MHTMAFPISSTRHTDRAGRTGARAFTLVELMISASIGAFVLTGVLTTFLLIGRSGTNAFNYCDLDANTRQGLESFSREARIASNVTAFSSTSVTLVIPDTNPATTYTYSVTYECILDPNQTAYPGQYAFVRYGPPLTQPLNSDGTAATSVYTTLIHNVDLSTFKLNYYTYTPGLSYSQDQNYTAGSVTAIKQVELTLTARRSNVTAVNATNAVLSARFILRNKP
jgi:Tfp pilus assembly protein PilW